MTPRSSGFFFCKGVDNLPRLSYYQALGKNKERKMKYYTVIKDNGDGTHAVLRFQNAQEANTFYRKCQEMDLDWCYEEPTEVDTTSVTFFMGSELVDAELKKTSEESSSPEWFTSEMDFGYDLWDSEDDGPYFSHIPF